MPHLYYALAWIIIMFCQAVLSPRISIAGVYPDVVIASVILIGMKRGWQNGLWFGFAFGLSLDLYNPAKMGWMTLAVALAGMISGIIKEKIYVESLFYQSAILAAVVFLYKITAWLIESPVFFSDNITTALLTSLLTAVYTALFAAVVLLLLKQRYRLKELL